MRREFSGRYRSYSSLPRKRESGPGRPQHLPLDPRFRGGDGNRWEAPLPFLSQAGTVLRNKLPTGLLP